ncbi:MAG: RNA methyltransferase [Bacteroidales bacterium]|nr:RNA methyltransferase [Bacteroidales bacterium]
MRKLQMDELHRKTIEECRRADKLPVLVVLDNVRSLHNIGSVFRTSDAFLIEAVYLCGISSVPPNPEIHKSALGAEFSVAWKYFAETREAVAELRAASYAVYAVEQTEHSINLCTFKVVPDIRYALVFGNEVRGVDQAVVDLCDGSIEIPQFGTKHSFNVSVSAGIVLWELYRQLAQNVKTS